jgi:hypothetical protein
MMPLSPIFPGLFDPTQTNPELHIPDGFLNFAIAAIFWVVTIALIAVATRRTESKLGERQIPLMGIMAAFIFAGQMINFPVAGGTSGHLLGGALAAIGDARARVTPIGIDGLAYRITVSDSHLAAGCQCWTFDEWRAKSHDEIHEMDGKKAVAFYPKLIALLDLLGK